MKLDDKSTRRSTTGVGKQILPISAHQAARRVPNSFPWHPVVLPSLNPSARRV
jgi:hypothetical protein